MWFWMVIWLLLALAAVATFGLLGWRLVRQVLRLGREIARNADRMAEAMNPGSRPYLPATSVLVDPGTVAPSGPNHAPRHAADQ